MNEISKEFRMIKDFPFFLCATISYALFYVICLYKNGSGITFPLFTLGTIIYFALCLKKLEVNLKPYSIFYIVCIELLGLSTCLTESWVIIFFNKTSIIFLVIVFLLHNFYEVKNWNFVGYIKAYLKTIFYPVGFIYKPFSHLSTYKKIREDSNKEKINRKILYVFVGILVSIPLLCIIVALLVSSDMVFEKLFNNLVKDITIPSLVIDGIWMSILFIFVFLCAYMLLSFLSIYRMENEEKENKKGEPVLAITISSILSVVYIIFCSIQVMYLFLGRTAGLSLPEGMTYSEYAREGFFQLLFVCIINLILVLIGIYLFRESKVLKVFLCIITSCTFIMIISSALRMILYIQHQYLTFLRVFVLWALFVIFFVMIGVTITIFKKDFNFFKYATVTVTVLYLILSYARVDYIVAKVNVDNMEEETQYEFFKGTELYDDPFYLTENLSYDAAPVIIGYEQEVTQKIDYVYNRWRRYYIDDIIEETEDMGIRDFNVSKFIARNLALKNNVE